MIPERTWFATLERAGRWADGVDRPRSPGASGALADGVIDLREDGSDAGTQPADHSEPDPFVGPGVPASVWAMAKTTLGALGAPVALPVLAMAAVRTAQIARARIDEFPDHLHALAEGRTPPLPGDRTVRLPASGRYLITSDLHRCIPGRLDWPRRQGVKRLYAEVLGEYAADGWSLIENGDIEDFWMVGGSTWGVVYDLVGLAELATGSFRPDTTRPALESHLDRIVANNAGIYRVLRDGFAAQGRYHRTMGNHDDVFGDPAMVDRLAEHLPGTAVADTILLEREGSSPADGIGGIDAVVAHGHLTDSWNGPGFSLLGRAVTWVATTLDDLPRVPGTTGYDGVPEEAALSHLLADRGRNRLITVDPRYGGNRRLDTLDEERLFDRLAQSAPEGGWPWLVHGHTHYPMLRPHDRSGEPVRYANSGFGAMPGAFTALEWDGSRPDDPLRLVVWLDRWGRAPERVELEPDGAALRTV